MAITLDADARTDVATVKAAFDTSLDADAIKFWINAAYPDIDAVANAGTNLSSDELARLEAIWAMHKASAQDPRATQRSGESRSESYGDRPTYREMAVELDDTGTLAGAGKPTASLSAPDVKSTD